MTARHPSIAWFERSIVRITRALENENLRRKRLDVLAVLGEGSCSHDHHALVRFGARVHYFNDLTFHAKCIARARRLGPGNFATQADHAARERQALHQKAHGCSRCVPTAGGESAENAVLGSRFVKMKWLRVELSGERFHPAHIHAVLAGGESLADV